MRRTSVLMLALAALPVAVSPAAPRRSLQEAPQHLRWSTTYDTFFPDSRGWINMGLSIYSEMWPGGCSEHATGPGGCGLQAKLAAWKQFGIPSFYDLCDHPCQQSTCPNITNASAPWGEFGSCPIWRKGDGLLPGWEAALEKQVMLQIKPHFGDGKALRGVFLGDELCCCAGLRTAGTMGCRSWPQSCGRCWAQTRCSTPTNASRVCSTRATQAGRQSRCPRTST